MKALIYFLSVFCLTAFVAQSQVIFVYDQQSATEANFQGESSFTIQDIQPVGQSFTPTLSLVGFVRLALQTPLAGPTADVYVDLWAGSIGGTLLGSSDPVNLPLGFDNFVNFFYSSPVAVTPGTQYYFQPVVEPGGGNTDLRGTYTYGYNGGEFISQGTPYSGLDMWFREGIYIVPEPSPLWLVLLGGGIWFYVRRTHKRHRVA